jgi:hypothetical protein
MFCFKQISFIFKISIFFVLVFITLPGSAVHSADVILTWNKPNDSRVTGYIIFYGPADTDFTSTPKEIINSPDQTSCDIFNLEDGQKYGFAAKSFDRHNNKSVFSEVIFYEVPKTQDMLSSDDADSNKNIDDNSDINHNGDGGSNKDNDTDDDIEDKNTNSDSSGGGCFISQVLCLSTNN